MSTATASTAPAAPALPGVRTRVRVGQVLLALLLVVCGLVAVGTAFASDPLPREGIVLVATYGVLAAVLGLALVWCVAVSRAAQLALWALPLFFVVHVAAFGTWLPDGVFAVAAAVGALLVQGRVPSRS